MLLNQSRNTKFTTILILSLAFWLCIGFGLYLYVERIEEIRIEKIKTYERRSAAVVDKKFVNKMKHHGIWPHGPFPVCDGNPEVCVFERDGQRVRM